MCGFQDGCSGLGVDGSLESRGCFLVGSYIVMLAFLIMMAR